MINLSRNIAAIGLADLDAKIARTSGDSDGEIAHLRRAVELQDKLTYMEPPEWHYSIREALGGALLRRGAASDAEAIFRKELENNPRNGRALFGLLESLQAQQKTASVEWVKREFADAWKHSSSTLKLGDL
jgi:tetratricopeptide (TPR) repeat protein